MQEHQPLPSDLQKKFGSNQEQWQQFVEKTTTELSKNLNQYNFLDAYAFEPADTPLFELTKVGPDDPKIIDAFKTHINNKHRGFVYAF